MNANDFRRIALSLEGAEESSHMGNPDFRVGGRIFATLAAQDQGYGNLMLTLEQQTAFVEELPEVFLPIAGGWGRMGMTHIRLAVANEDTLTGALHAAWKLRVEKNAGGHKGSAKVPMKATVAKKPVMASGIAKSRPAKRSAPKVRTKKAATKRKGTTKSSTVKTRTAKLRRNKRR